MKNNRIYIFVILLVFLGTGVWYVTVKEKMNSSTPSPATQIAQATYLCSDSKTIQATFYKGETIPVTPGEMPIPSGSTKLVLSDGRNFDLPQTISADGGRYANSDESFVFWNKGDTAFITEGSMTTFKDCIQKVSDDTPTQTGLANPASTNCSNNGGTLEMRKNKIGEYGVCIFKDNQQCEEWALLRGECPVGGLKITGYENDAEIYCAITGGQVEGVGTQAPMCKRIDGTYCTAQANLDGDCPIPNDPNPSSGNTEAP